MPTRAGRGAVVRLTADQLITVLRQDCGRELVYNVLNDRKKILKKKTDTCSRVEHDDTVFSRHKIAARPMPLYVSPRNTRTTLLLNKASERRCMEPFLYLD